MAVAKKQTKVMEQSQPIAVTPPQLVERKPKEERKKRQLDQIQVARLASLALHPFLISPLAIVLVLYFDTGKLLVALGWAGLCAAFVVGPALVYLRRKLQKKQYTDADVSVREHRTTFYLFGGICMVLCFGTLLWLDAPRPLIALFIIALCALIVFAAVNRLGSKVSIHSGAMVGTTVAVAFYSWPTALILALGAALVTWSRLVLRRHTPLEAALGWGISSLMVAVGMAVFV
jgi:uncharacterized membrane protein